MSASRAPARSRWRHRDSRRTGPGGRSTFGYTTVPARNYTARAANWRSSGFAAQMKAAMAVTPHFHGPLTAPDEPWHYFFDPDSRGIRGMSAEPPPRQPGDTLGKTGRIGQRDRRRPTTPGLDLTICFKIHKFHQHRLSAGVASAFGAGVQSEPQGLTAGGPPRGRARPGPAGTHWARLYKFR